MDEMAPQERDHGDAPLWARVVAWRFTPDSNQTGFVPCLQAHDVPALGVVAFFDNPDTTRFGALSATEMGAELTADIAARILDGQECSLVEKVRSIVFERIAAFPNEIPLNDATASIIAERIAGSSPDTTHIDAELRWLGTHDRQVAVGVARTAAENATAGPPFEILLASCRALIEFGSEEDVDVVYRTAERLAVGGYPDVAGELAAGALTSSPSAARLVPLLSRFASNGWPLGAPLAEAIESAEPTLVLEMATALPIGWCGPHLLQPLSRRDGMVIVGRLADLPAEQRAWVIDNGGWSDDAYEALARAASELDEPVVDAIFRRIAAQTSATLASSSGMRVFPRLGIKLLCEAVLSGRLDVESPALGVLALAPSTTRVSVFRRLSWRSPERAVLMMQLVVKGSLDDVVELSDELRNLGAPARSAALEHIAPLVPDPIAAKLVELFADDEVALASLSSAPIPAGVVLQRWVESDDMTAFRALDASEHSATRLDHARELLLTPRAGDNHAMSDLTEVLTELARAHAHLEVCLFLCTPDAVARSSLLVAALRILAEASQAEDLGSDVLAACATLCRNNTSVDVRRASYEVLRHCAVQPALVELLVERREVEPLLQEDVSALIAHVVDRLEMQLQDGQLDDVGPLALLQQLSPQAAVAHARRFAADPHRPENRRVGVQILGDHGDPQTDLPTLQDAVRDPNAEVQAAARSALRRLTVGDIQRAHERLGELAAFEPEWQNCDPVQLYGDHAEPIREALDRVAMNETKGLPGQAIDQLSEVAKYLLFRYVATLGADQGVSPDLVQRCARNDVDYGTVLRNGSLMGKLPWLSNLSALYEQRTEHPTRKRSLTVVPSKTDEDLEHAYRLFRDGVAPLLNALRKAVAEGSPTD